MTAATFGVPFQPLHQVSHLGGERWRADGDDPQLLLAWPEALPAGPYRITISLEASATPVPQLYLDCGQGWSEATRIDFRRGPCGRRWSAVAWLEDAPPPARLDPTSFAGEFGFGGILVERLDEAALVLETLASRAVGEPGRAAELLEQAFHVAVTQGVRACVARLDEERGAAEPPPAVGTYAEWVRQYDTAGPATLRALHEVVQGLPRRPQVALVLPAGELSMGDLRACIDSILGQIYPDWMLHIVFDQEVRRDLGSECAALASAHSRIRIVCCAGAAATDAGAVGALLAGGDAEFVAVLEDAPLLAPHALLACMRAVVARADAAIVYGDCDRLDGAGRRIDPDFKPEWNPDLFLAQDYLAPFALLAIDALRAAGGVPAAPPGALAAALALRLAADVDAERVLHVPAILCHARAGAGDVALATRRRAVQDELRHSAPGVEVEPTAYGLDVRWPLPRPVPRVSLVIPTRDRVALLRRCVDSICALTTYPEYEVLVVDNRSQEPETLEYLETLAARPRVRVLRHDAEFNYSAINNAAVQQVDGDIVGLVNNDIEAISPDWLERMVQHAVRPGIGAVGAMLYYPDDTIQHAGVTIGLGGVAGHPYSRAPRGTAGTRGRVQLVQNVSAVTGACLLVKREIYLAVGGLDESLAVAFNDVDFCLRLLERGYRNVWTPYAELYHHESASRGAEDSMEKLTRFHGEVARMVERWGARLGADPAYNPNLSLAHGEPHRLAAPPRFSVWSWMQGQAR